MKKETYQKVFRRGEELLILAVALLLIGQVSLKDCAFAEIMCQGAYGGHLQGIAVDEEKAIFWSFTVNLVKTDMEGKFLESVPVTDHHGDLTVYNGKVYVAVNIGKFNQEPGQANSYIYV